MRSYDSLTPNLAQCGVIPTHLYGLWRMMRARRPGYSTVSGPRAGAGYRAQLNAV